MLTQKPNLIPKPTTSIINKGATPAIILPTEKLPVERKSPAQLLMYGMPKVGKTTALSGLEGCLILELDPKGADHLEFLGIKIKNYQHLMEVADAIIKAGKPYKYVAIDTLTILEEWALQEALRMYKAHPTGVKFTGESVLILEWGQGYHWLRMAWDKIMRKLQTLADNMIFVAHLRDREISKGGSALTSKEIQLIGQLREITCAKVGAIGFVRQKVDGKNYLSFKPKTSENIICRARARHLTGQDILLSEFVDGELVTHWNEIYID